MASATEKERSSTTALPPAGDPFRIVDPPDDRRLGRSREQAGGGEGVGLGDCVGRVRRALLRDCGRRHGSRLTASRMPNRCEPILRTPIALGRTYGLGFMSRDEGIRLQPLLSTKGTNRRLHIVPCADTMSGSFAKHEFNIPRR